MVKAAILSGTYGLDSLLAFNLKLLDINPLGHAQLSWRSYHGPTPINSRDAFLLSSERSLGLESAIPSSASKMVSSGSQEILYQALRKPDRASSTSTSTLSRVSSFLRKTPPPAPSQRGSPATSSKSEPVRDNTAGFVFAWTSFDDVCDNILELRHAVERAVPGHPIQISDYTRMSMCVGGWLCESSPTGGCDVSLFIDSNLYDDLSHWMTNVLTQSIMIESMEDLRTNVIASMPTSNDKSRHSYHCLPDSLYGGIRQQLKRISEDAEHAHTGHEPIFKYQSPQSKLVDGNHNDNYFSPLKDHERTQHKLVEKLKIPLQTVQAELDTTSTTSSAPSSGRQNSSTEPSESQDDFHTPRRNKIVSARTPRSPQSDHSVTPLRAIKQHIRSLGYTDFSVESINMLFQYTDFVEMSASGEPVVRPPSTLVWQIRSKRDDMTLYKTMVPGSTWQLIKCSCYMNFKKEPIQQLLSDDSRLGLYDDMFDYCTYLHSSDPFTNVRRMCFKPVWPTSPRDFVVATTTYHMADGSALLATRSQSGIMDEQAGYVRGRLHVSGFLIVPCSLLPEDPVAGTVPDGCRVTLVVHIDLGGNLPSGPLNYFTMNAPLRLLSRVKEVLLQDQIAAGSTKINDE